MSLDGLRPGELLDRFEVEAVLGRGGMATVYRVRHLHLETRHALKVLDVSLPSEHARLLREGRTQATLRHPNIVAVTDVVPVGRALGLVMELVEGPDLATWLREVRATVEQVDELAEGLFAAVEAAHRAGVVHRDLKPGNVLLDVREDRLVPRVADFGLAKLLDFSARGELTRSGATLGTPAYMAPEQIGAAAAVDHRADLFSLGAVLYQLLAGQAPFAGEDLVSLLGAVATARHTPLDALGLEVPERMARAVEGALVVDPDERWSDVAAFRAAWRGGEAEPAAPPAAWSVEGLAFARSLPAPDVVVHGSADTLAGLVPGLTNPTAAPLTLDPAPRGSLLLPALVVGASLLGAAGILVVGLRGPAVPVDAGAQGVQVVEPVPVVEEVEAPPPQPELASPPDVAPPVVPTPAPQRAAAPRRPAAEPAARQAPGEPEPEPPPEPVVASAPARVPDTGRLVVQGNAADVEVRDGSSARRAPGELPAGTYALWARFGDEAALRQVMQVELEAGQEVVVRCQSALRRCVPVQP